VGMALHGLSRVSDVRPHQQDIEFWNGPVQPEVVLPGSQQWARHRLHNAANLWHVQQRLGITSDRQRKYKVAWVGGCCMYDTARLREVGASISGRNCPWTTAVRMCLPGRGSWLVMVAVLLSLRAHTIWSYPPPFPTAPATLPNYCTRQD
jgi:hypothetical protein